MTPKRRRRSADPSGEWRTRADKDADVVALLTAAWADDTDAGAEVLESSSRGQALILLWSLARGWVWAWKNGTTATRSARCVRRRCGSRKVRTRDMTPIEEHT